MNCYRSLSNTIDYQLYRLITPGLTRQRQLLIWTIGVITSAWKELTFFTHLSPYTHVQILQADLHTLP